MKPFHQLTLFEQTPSVASGESVMLSVERNKGEGNAILISNRIHFEGQTKWVLEQLLTGRKISGTIARDEFNIMDLRARIYTIKKNGIEVLHNSIEGAKGMREYYLSPEEIKRVKQMQGEEGGEG